MPKGIIGITRTESQQELAEYYSMADTFVNLTYLDTFPTVNLEALACGTPVITYDTGGSPESICDDTCIDIGHIIKNYPCGSVVKQGDIQSVVEAIYEIRRTPLSPINCRKRAEKYFDKDKCFAEYIELYEDLIQ